MRSVRALVWAGATTAFALACAVSVPPSGGPEDKTPPGVVGSIPAAGSTGVDPGTAVAISFSEPMTRKGVERTLSFSPAIEYDEVKWDDRTLIIRVAGGLHPDTTYVVTLDRGYRDVHGVAATSAFELAFATSATLDTARIEGTVYFKREPTANGVVRCFRLPRDSSFTPESGRPDRQSVTTGDGTYRLRYLSPRGDRFIVWAFEDRNRNGAYEPASEFATTFPDTVVLSAATPVAAACDIMIIDPNEPGNVQGRVANASGIDTVAVTVTLSAAADTLRPRYLAQASPRGEYAFDAVRPGSYALAAFVDLRADSVCGTYPCGADSASACPEPCVVAADSVVVGPGAKVVVPELRLAPAAEEEP